MATRTRYAQLYFALFGGFALHTTYLTLYYHRQGYSDWMIGVLEAVGSVCVILSAFVWGPLGDRIHRKHSLLAWLGVGLAAIYPLLYLAGTRLWLLVPLVIGLYLCRSPLIPLIDTTCLDELAAGGDAHGSSYGGIRLWGSVGFIVTASLLPLLLPRETATNGVMRLAPVFVAFALCHLALAGRAAAMGEPRPREHQPIDDGHLRAVLRLPSYKRLLAVLLVSWMSNQCYYLFLSLYLEKIGVSDRSKGMYWSMGVLAEILLLAAGPWLMRRVPLRSLMLAGLLGRFIRLAGFCFPQHPAVVLWFFQPLHALGFAAVHLATMGYLTRLVPANLRATGQVLVAGLVTGVGGVAGNLLAGRVSVMTQHGPALWGLRGINAAYAVCAVIQLVVVVAAWLSLREPPSAAA